MLEGLRFLLAHYAVLAAFLLLFYLTGGFLLRRYADPGAGGRVFLYASSGMGVCIVVLFLLCLFDQFNRTAVLATILLFLLVFLFRRGDRALLAETRARFTGGVSRTRLCVLVALGILLAPLLLLPLYPPVHWDEMSYHLPYARFYVEQGGLAVNPFLRYPLYAHNMDLLYALSLLFFDDILAHLFHAAAALLTAVGIYSLGTMTADRRTGLVAVLAFLSSSHVATMMKTAYVDLGLALFVFLAFYCISLWSIKRATPWLCLAGFAAGIAAGSKYSGLFYLPLFAAWIALESRKASAVVRFLVPAALFGMGWYARNWIISGNPLSPFAGNVFGYWLWNEADALLQAGDLAKYGTPKSIVSLLKLPWNLAVNAEKFHYEGAVSPLMLASFVAFLFFRRFNAFNRKLAMFVLAGLLMWFFTSQVLRYLLPVFPMIALLSAKVLVLAYDGSKEKVISWLHASPPASKNLARRAIGAGAACLVAAPMALTDAVILRELAAEPVPVTEQMRTGYLSRKVPSFDLLQVANRTPGLTIYQLGFENSFYWADGKMMGDWVGPARYSDLAGLLPDPERTHARLQQMGAQLLLVNSLGHFNVRFGDAAAGRFGLIAEDRNGRLYRVLDTRQ